MQNNYVTDAINLKSYNLSESDKIIVMYSKEKGLIKGIAKGVKKPKSKLGARMDLLVANTVMLHKGRNFSTICQAESLATFKQTRTDLDKIFYSMYVAEVVNNFGLEDDPSSQSVYELLYKALEHISNAKDKVQIFLAVIKFQLKMMIISGFSLEFDNCLNCRHRAKDEDVYFVPKLGGIICKDCINHVPYSKKKMPAKLCEFFKQMSANDFDYFGEYELKANEKVCEVTFDVMKDYIEKKSPKKIKSSNVMTKMFV
ncbi:DNA repair protein RecO [bacterium]|nr:DNA repair protein RecO [bacterium]